VRVAEIAAAVYVVSPVRATSTGYEPAFAGAIIFTEAAPKLSVVAFRMIPLSVNERVLPAMAAPDPVLSVAERGIKAPGAAVVGPA
jgi:uncharacterized protein (UPF0254 family)